MFKGPGSVSDCTNPNSSPSATLSNLFSLLLSFLIYKMGIVALTEWFEWLKQIIRGPLTLQILYTIFKFLII